MGMNDIVYFLFLLQGYNVNAVTIDHVTPLHEACLGDHVACARTLLEAGANVSSKSKLRISHLLTNRSQVLVFPFLSLFHNSIENNSMYEQCPRTASAPQDTLQRNPSHCIEQHTGAPQISCFRESKEQKMSICILYICLFSDKVSRNKFSEIIALVHACISVSLEAG